MKPTHGHTKKHAGSPKHHKSTKHKPTAAQLAAAKLAAHKRKLQKAAALAAHLHAVAKGATPAVPAKWSPSVDVAACAIEALAASLRMAGHPVADTDVLDLYWRVTEDPDAGMTLESAIGAAFDHGLAGVTLLGAAPARRLGDGVVLGVQLRERHALAVDGHGVWSWGQWRPASCGLLAAADEAWALDWAVTA